MGTAARVSVDAEHPWPGPAPYDEEASEFFNGRESEAAELLRLIRLSPFVTLYGKSGLGKSSLLQAGLFPLLREARFLPVYLRLNYSTDCTVPLLEQAATRLRAEADAWDADAQEVDEGETFWAYLQRRERPIWTRDNFPLTPVLVFDQFEEIFSRSGSPEKSKVMLDCMADLVGDRLSTGLAEDRSAARRLNLQSQQYRVVLSFRSEFLADLETWEKASNLPKRDSMHLVAMSRDHAIDAVERSGAQVLDIGVAGKIVDFVLARDSDDALRTTDVEPVLLSLCCYQLNSRRETGRRIDARLLETAGADILRNFYDEALRGMRPDVAVFIEDNLVQGRYRSSYPRDEALSSGAMAAAELDTLMSRRLLRVDPQGGVPRIELIHDRVVGVVRESRNARLEQRRVVEARSRAEHEALDASARVRAEHAEQAKVWAEAERRRVARWRNGLAFAVLLLIVALLGAYRQAGNARQQAALATQARAIAEVEAAKAAAAKIEADKAKAEAETARDEAKQKAEAATDSEALAMSRKHEAEDQAQRAGIAEKKAVASGKRAEGLRLAVVSQAMLDGSKSGGDELAFKELLAAHLLNPSPEITGSMGNALVARQYLRRFAPIVVEAPSPFSAVAFSPDGLWIATGHDDGTVSLRRRAAPAVVVATSRLHTATVQFIAWRRDSQRFVSASNDSTLRQWSLTLDGGQPLVGHQGAVYSVAYDPDGSHIVSAGHDGDIRFWSAADGSPSGEKVHRPVPVFGVSWPADGTTVVAVEGASSNGSLARDQSHLIVVDESTRLVVKMFDAHTGDAKVVALSTDGHYAISGGDDFLVRRRDLTRDSLTPTRMAGHKSSIASVAASPDPESRVIASGGDDGSVRLWSSRTGEPIGVPLPGADDPVTALAFSPDAKWLAAGADSLMLWELDSQWDGSPADRIGLRAVLTTKSVRGLADHQQATIAADTLYLGTKTLVPKRLSQEAPLVACAAAPDPRVQSQGKTIERAAPSIKATGLARSADGLQVYSGHSDGKLRRWRVSSSDEPNDPIALSTCAIGALATSADGQRLYAASADRIFVIDLARWRVERQLADSPGASALAVSDDGRRLVWSGRRSMEAMADARALDPSDDQAPWAVMSRDLTLDSRLGATSERRLMSSTSPILALALSHDLRYVAAITGRALRFRDQAAGQALPPIELPRTRISGLWFDSDGRRVYTEAADGVVKPWPLPDQWPGLMCGMVGGNLSRKAWRENISAEVPYMCQCPGMSIEPDDPKSTSRREACPVEGASTAARIARRNSP